jgi:uncharacterized repeat protein (TIGR03803 family)
VAGGGTANEGVAYKVSPSGQETILHTFTGGADGGLPNGLTIDSAGNLYGTTFGGGSASGTGLQEGVVFKIDPSGQETVLYSFTGFSDGGDPTAGVVLDSAGNLYGTTFYGGFGAGVIYEVTAAGQETALYAFGGGADGANPNAGVIRDAQGNLYGTTANSIPNGGVIYELSASGEYTVLYTFGAEAAGGDPLVGVVRDSAGNLYGATSSGGTMTCGQSYGCGTVYELSAAGEITVLQGFTGGPDGSGSGAVVLDPAGDLYGPAGLGAAGGGLVYRLTPQ